jgi:hypothetical protein
MKKNQKKDILERILAYFLEIAPVIVKDSVDSLSNGKPAVDLYDVDFYMSKMAGAFDDIAEEILREVTEEHVEEINAIFFKHYKEAKIIKK